MATAPFVCGRGRTSNSWRKTLPYFGSRNKKNWVVLKRCNTLQKSTTANGTSCVAKNPSGCFTISANLLRPLELVPASRERVVPRRMASPHVHWRLHIKGKGDSSSSTSVFQYALISDFLDLAHLSFQEEAALATNWINDRPEGLKLPNLALATRTGEC